MTWSVRDALLGFIDEDLAWGDPTSDLLSGGHITGRMVSRQRGIISGTRHAETIFGTRNCTSQIVTHDGCSIAPGGLVMTVSGPAVSVLSLERTALNLVSRMSGIATLASALSSRLPSHVTLLSTRKTAPGLRFFDKEAVETGGGKRHRMNLGEMIMIKDNHMRAEGSLERLVLRARKKGVPFEVEVDTCEDALRVSRMGAPRILLDNFTPDGIRSVVSALVREGLRDSVKLEASGGITLENIAEYGNSGVDYVSVGYMTNSVPALDLGLDI